MSDIDIQIIRPSFPASKISHVIFDFDGTLSWLRHGWPEMMYELFREYLPVHPTESEKDLHDFLIAEILSLNGKPSIYQMLRFAELVKERGGNAPSSNELLDLYQGRLDAAIAERSQKVRHGKTKPDEFVIFRARPLLEELQRRGLTLIILSGTIEHRVKEEAALLDLARYFGRHIYGSTPDPTQFSKRAVMERLLQEERISGEHLLSFGDGPVEIQGTKDIGGRAIGVTSNENENSGRGPGDIFKATQLTKAGADALIPDYRHPTLLLEKIFGK